MSTPEAAPSLAPSAPDVGAPVQQLESARGAIPAPKPRSRWFRSLALEGLLALALVFGLLLLGTFLVMNTYGRRLVAEESRRKIEEAGNKSVEELQRRSREISALVKTLATTAEALPHEVATFTSTLPKLIDFNGDSAIAGGGYWPEPGWFEPGVERRSFFWGRDASSQLKSFDDYNAPLGPGYHNEEWYVPVRFLPPGSVFWSRSYQDPYSYQPMTTCTANSFVDGRFVGTATIDLKLEGLAALVETWRRDIGGYGFLLDRNNKFLTYPRPERVRIEGVDDAGKKTSDFIYAADLAKAEPRFAPLAELVARMDREILARARQSPAYDASIAAKIDAASYAINADEAQYIAAVMADPLREQRDRANTRLFDTVELQQDAVTDVASVAFLFNVPDTYWKLVLVAPKSGLEAVAARISRSLLVLISGLLALVLLPSYLFLSRKLIHPITTLAQAAGLVRDGDLGVEVAVRGQDEIAALGSSFNEMVGRLRANTESLNQTNRELARTLSMTDTIMSTVREGLFLLDPDLRIAPKYSQALGEILGAEKLAGESFLDLIRGLTPEKTHELSARFLKLLFNAAKTDSVISKINPLREVEASFPGPAGQLEQKYLTFTFDRIREGSEIRQAMVTVSDVTSRVLLARQLKESQQRMERQAELLLSVMHVEPQMLRDFIEGAHSELERINEMLREGRTESLSATDRQGFFRQLAEQIYRSVHTIKGTASMLRIDYFAVNAHRFEEKLSQLRTRRSLDGSDFVPIVLELSEMIDSLVEVRDVIARFSDVQRDPAVPARSDGELLEGAALRFAAELGEKYGKSAAVQVEARDSIQIPFRYKTTVQNIVAQLVRNSMVHGIETPAERVAAGKPERGTILLAARQSSTELELFFRDDGRGIDYNKIIARVRDLAKDDPALLERLIDREQNRWKVKELDEMLFHPGFSTSAAASVDAGRGFGLNAVREMVAKAGGRISVRNRPGQLCEFQIALPLAGEAEGRMAS